jgi:hypothetical protein
MQHGRQWRLIGKIRRPRAAWKQIPWMDRFVRVSVPLFLASLLSVFPFPFLFFWVGGPKSNNKGRGKRHVWRAAIAFDRTLFGPSTPYRQPMSC